MATTTALLNSICLKHMIAVTCQVMIMYWPITHRKHGRDGTFLFHISKKKFSSNFSLNNKRDINLFQPLRGNNAMKMQIVKKLSSAMGIRRPAEKVHWIRKNSILHSALGASVMITSVKNGNMTVTMTPTVRDL